MNRSGAAECHCCPGNGEILLGLPSRTHLISDCMQPYLSCTSIFPMYCKETSMIFELQNSWFLKILHAQRENRVFYIIGKWDIFTGITLTRNSCFLSELFKHSGTLKTNQNLSDSKASEAARWVLFLTLLFWVVFLSLELNCPELLKHCKQSHFCYSVLWSRLPLSLYFCCLSFSNPIKVWGQWRSEGIERTVGVLWRTQKLWLQNHLYSSAVDYWTMQQDGLDWIWGLAHAHISISSFAVEGKTISDFTKNLLFYKPNLSILL